MKLKHGLFALCALALVNCTHKSSAPESDGDLTPAPVKVQVDDQSQLSEGEKKLYAKIEKLQAISFREVTKLLIERHAKAAQATHPEITSQTLTEFINKVKPAAGQSPAKTKIAYENNIKALNGGKPMLYNIDKTNIADIYAENRMQCYSGTYLYQLIRRQAGANAFRAGHEVVIFTSGHVLPGYMVMDKNVGTGKQEWKLIGVETTRQGGARRDFGFVSNGVPGTVVVDAELFALSEIFGDKMSNQNEFANEAITWTAKKYGIDISQSSHAVGTSADEAETKRQLNQSVFAFGAPESTEKGDQERAESPDDGSASDLYPDKPVVRQTPELEYLLRSQDCRALEGEWQIAAYENAGYPMKFIVKSCDQIFARWDAWRLSKVVGDTVILKNEHRTMELRQFNLREGSFVTDLEFRKMGLQKFFKQVKGAGPKLNESDSVPLE